jgi:hypothetical protein
MERLKYSTEMNLKRRVEVQGEAVAAQIDNEELKIIDESIEEETKPSKIDEAEDSPRSKYFLVISFNSGRIYALCFHTEIIKSIQSIVKSITI